MERRGAPRGLVLGFGNPGRADDALGPMLVESLEPELPEGVEAEVAFQPGIEHAASAAEHDWVLFVGAASEGRAPFRLERLVPASNVTFSTHVVDLGSILAIAAESFGSRTPAWLLAVRGYDFDMGERLSAQAGRNLDAALACAREFVARMQDGKGERDEQDRQSNDSDH